MFITGINKLFYKHGKIAFGILTVVIIIPFVLYFSADPSDLLGMFSFGGTKSNVSMYGERVPQKELDQGVKNVKIIFTLRGWPVNFESTQNHKQYLSMAIEQLMLIKQAEKLGLAPTDTQVAEFLQGMPMFKVKGKFNMDRYRMIVYALGQYRISEMDIESAAKDSILINLLRKQIASTAVVTENGAQQFYNKANEKYSINVAYFDSKDYLSKVKVENKELDEYFQANRSKYVIPKKSKVSIVRFNFINYKKQAKKEVTDKMIDANYQQNKMKYKKDSEADAKSKIKDLLIKQKEQKLAKTDAQSFAVKAFKNIEQLQAKGKNAQIFSQFSKKLKYNVYPINDWITADTKLIPRIGKEAALANDISNLFMDQPISNAIEGKKAYFVACLTARKNARPAELSEVKDKVISAYKNEQAVKMAQNAADKVSADITKGINEKKSVKSLVQTSSFSKKFEFTAEDSFSLTKESYGKKALKLAVKTKKGGVSSVADISNGAIIVYVDNITLPSQSDFSKNKILAMMEYKQYAQQISWLNYNQMLEKKAKTMIYASSKKGAGNQ
jgi:peptidyl-prolyl cis-trans isomerase D